MILTQRYQFKLNIDYLIICGKCYNVKLYNTIFTKKETSFEFQCSGKKTITKIINLGKIQIIGDNYIPKCENNLNEK